MQTTINKGPYNACCSQDSQCISRFCLKTKLNGETLGRCNEHCFPSENGEIGSCCRTDSECTTNICLTLEGYCGSNCPLELSLKTSRADGECCDEHSQCASGNCGLTNKCTYIEKTPEKSGVFDPLNGKFKEPVSTVSSEVVDEGGSGVTAEKEDFEAS